MDRSLGGREPAAKLGWMSNHLSGDARDPTQARAGRWTECGQARQELIWRINSAPTPVTVAPARIGRRTSLNHWGQCGPAQRLGGGGKGVGGAGEHPHDASTV